MGSQIDLDQGGTFRQTQKIYLGPSVGWIQAQQQTVLPITSSGATSVQRGMNLVTINVNGNVTINLPSAKASAKGPQAIPGQWFLNPVVIVDIGGFAAANTYTILPNGSETIDGLASIRLSAPYGVYVLKPILETGGWNLMQ
jgi:hypothetical protein